MDVAANLGGSTDVQADDALLPSEAMRTKHLLFALLVAVSGVAGADAVATSTTAATSVPFQLALDGVHAQGVGPSNLRHEGSFTATSPACAAGHGVDRELIDPVAALREYTCDDGSGSFTALVDPVVAEPRGLGVWRILGGTGRYAKLRGQGTFESELVGGALTDETTVAFRTTWVGVAAFDDVAPALHGVQATTAQLRHPIGGYLLRISFSIRDDLDGSAVEYLVLPSSGSYRLPFSQGSTSTGRVSVALEIHPPGNRRRIRLEIRATDAVGNRSTIVRSMKLPRQP